MISPFIRVSAVVVATAALAGCTRDSAYLLTNKIASSVVKSEESPISYSQYDSDRRSRLREATLAAKLRSEPDAAAVREEILKIVPLRTPWGSVQSTLAVNGFVCVWDKREKGSCTLPEAGNREVVVTLSEGALADVAVVTVK